MLPLLILIHACMLGHTYVLGAHEHPDVLPFSWVAHPWDPFLHSVELIWRGALPAGAPQVYDESESVPGAVSVQATATSARFSVRNTSQFNRLRARTVCKLRHMSWTWCRSILCLVSAETPIPSAGIVYPKINWLKAGFLSADKLLTVSPNYAAEVAANQQLGVELDHVIRGKGIEGIVNGMDVEDWSPAGGWGGGVGVGAGVVLDV